MVEPAVEGRGFRWPAKGEVPFVEVMFERVGGEVAGWGVGDFLGFLDYIW